MKDTQTCTICNEDSVQLLCTFCVILPHSLILVEEMRQLCVQKRDITTRDSLLDKPLV